MWSAPLHRTANTFEALSHVIVVLSKPSTLGMWGIVYWLTSPSGCKRPHLNRITLLSTGPTSQLYSAIWLPLRSITSKLLAYNVL